jgi:hypothetical protein
MADPDISNYEFDANSKNIIICQKITKQANKTVTHHLK